MRGNSFVYNLTTFSVVRVKEKQDLCLLLKIIEVCTFTVAMISSAKM